MKNVLRAGCKVNLFLNITGRRPDGYHTLETLFLPLPEPYDLLEIDTRSGSGLVFYCDDTDLSGPDNTVRKAYERYAAATGFAPSLAVTLRKGIPHGAGLGGGSADAGVFLRHLNELAPQHGCSGLDDAALLALAAGIGADVPFFLLNRPALATGVGDALTPVEPPLPGWRLVLVCPPVRVNTAWAFRAWDEKKTILPSAETLTRAGDTDTNPLVHGWHVENSFEPVVFAAYPQLSQIVAKFRTMKATAAAMSGSGSSLFGLFQSAEAAQKAVTAFQREGLRVFHHIL